ncbi:MULTISPECIES: hypothetical protein [unclassified Modestobacter]|nr:MULTISPECIES: hypothetical protein [unclassified Modestobacter]MCZ2826003.1 hypothetical protein [Modestobacter sp. VKM Ac-2981]MCZ2852932.1 hypothetical protein [Modestobacter sp. VKM Ac-2982]
MLAGPADGRSLGVFDGDFGDLIFDFGTEDDVAAMVSGLVCD